MEITVSEEVIKVIIMELEKRGYKVTKPEIEVPFPQDGDKYFFLEPYGKISWNLWDESNPLCKAHAELLNVFKTEDEAKFELNRRKVKAILWKYADHGPLEWDGSTMHYHLLYDVENDRLSPSPMTTYINDSIYFKSYENGLKAIEEAGKDRILKYIMGVVR